MGTMEESKNASDMLEDSTANYGKDSLKYCMPTTVMVGLMASSECQVLIEAD